MDTRCAADQYETPRLLVVGEAMNVVLGPPSAGWDGPYGISEPLFEFEQDDDIR